MATCRAEGCELCGDLYIVGEPHICRKENSYVPKLNLPRKLAKECEFKTTMITLKSQEKRIENQREEIRRLRNHIRSLEDSRNHWKEKAERLGKQLFEVLNKEQ